MRAEAQLAYAMLTSRDVELYERVRFAATSSPKHLYFVRRNILVLYTARLDPLLP